jgi:hypothetical protein
MRICAPFEVIGRARDPHGNGWGKLIRWIDEDKRLRTNLVRDADLHREISALTARRADMGLHVTLGCGRPLAAYLSRIESRAAGYVRVAHRMARDWWRQLLHPSSQKGVGELSGITVARSRRYRPHSSDRSSHS